MEKNSNNDAKLEKNKESSGNEKLVEEEAPEGGWGWVVTFAFIIVWITTYWPEVSFTLVFKDFLEGTGQSGSLTMIINSVYGITFSISSFAVTFLLKYFSMRCLGVSSAFLFATANIIMAFVRTSFQMVALFVVQGIGLGSMITLLNINFNSYFVKKRSMVMTISQVIISLGGICYPLGIEKLLEAYGSQGTAAILGALNLNCILGMSLMRPPPGWSYNKPKLDLADESKEPLVSVDSSPKTKTLEKWNSHRSLQDNFSYSTKLTAPIDENCKNGWSSLTNLKVQPGVETPKHARVSLVEDETEKNSNSSDSRIRRIIPTEYLELIYDRSFIITCLGVCFTLKGDFAFSAFLPLIMDSHGYTESSVSVTLTISMAADLASKIFLAILTTFIYEARPKHLFFVAMTGMALGKIGFMCFEDTLLGTMVMAGIIGWFHSWIVILMSIVVVEGLRIEQFPTAYGIFAIIKISVHMVFGPIAGILKDLTGSFYVCQSVLLAMNSFFIVPWAVDIMSNRSKTRRLNKEAVMLK